MAHVLSSLRKMSDFSPALAAYSIKAPPLMSNAAPVM